MDYMLYKHELESWEGIKPPYEALQTPASIIPPPGYYYGTPPRIRTENLLILSQAPLPVGPEGHCKWWT